MISKKILYSEQLLQLMLALSLLQVDPLNYFDLGFSRTHINYDGSPWQLEVRHRPFSVNPYIARKHFVPLIEDLVRFDGGFNDVQAWLLDLSDQPSTITNNSITHNISSPIQNEEENYETSQTNLVHNLNDPSIEELFLNTDHDNEAAVSIIDQNLADLYDYEGQHHMENKHGLYDSWDDLSNSRYVENGLSSTDLHLNLNALDSTFSWINNSTDENDNIENKFDEHENIKRNETKVSDELREKIKNNDVDELSNVSDVELTPEEMDLIEVLWKQDADLGFKNPLPSSKSSKDVKEAKTENEDIEKLNTLLKLKEDKNCDKNESTSNPWDGLPYTIDTETGEFILQRCNQDANTEELNNLLLDDAFQFVIDSDINNKDKNSEENSNTENSREEVLEEEEDLESVLINNLKFNGDDGEFNLNSPLSNIFDESDDLNILNEMMIQSSSNHFQHPRQPSQNYAHCVNGYRQNTYQGRVNLARSTMSMEQRWQDLANLLSFPPAMSMSDMSSHAAAHYSPHYGYQAHPAVLHNASLADIVSSQPNSSHHLQPYSGSNINLGSAVATSMHLTNSTSETDAGNSSYKMDHDMLYYSHTNPNELNHTSDGFLNILNDDDLLMDIAVNEGMYTMRMLDQNVTNSTNPHNAHLNNTIMGNSLPTHSAMGSMTASSNVTGNNDRLDASSDSAVSSMGSERVASLSDGEWNEGGSDSAQEYNVRKFSGPYDYRFNRMTSNRQPVAQKKHQMYGKRFTHDPSILHPPTPSMQPHPNVLPPEISSNIPMKFEPFDGYNNIDATIGASGSQGLLKPSTSSNNSEIKYSYALDFPHRQLKTSSSIPSSQETVSHNHTYALHPPHPPQIMNNNGANPKPQTRDKKAKKNEDEHMTRDEKRARALQIPITVIDIINLPMDEFNERLSKYDLSENQLSLIRDIRRRGKNKVAAQNCRKRKLDQIISLSDEVKEMKMRKDRFIREHEMLLTERRRVKDKFSLLYRHVFNNLRDSEGNAYSSYQYSLQQSADGSVVLVPRSSSEQSSENANGSGSSRQHNGQNSGNNNSTNFK